MTVSTTEQMCATFLAMLCCLTSVLAAPSRGYKSTEPDARSDGLTEISYPSLVDSMGQHLSYEVHLASNKPSNTNNHFHEALDSALKRTYFKFEAFGKRYLLNVSSSSHTLLPHSSAAAATHLPVVEYVKSDGSSSRTKIMNMTKDCFHTGHVHILSENEEEGGREKDGWVSISSCLGLHGIIATSEGYLLIEPSEAWQLSSTEDDGKQSHFVYRHSTAFHSHETCSAVNSGTVRPPLSDKLLRRRRKRNYGIDEYFVETAIIADKSMLDVHREDDLEAYLYTLINIVMHLYREPSIGHSINIVLVRTIILEDDPASLSTNNAYTLLNNFCEWQNSMNGRNGPHHDIAVMVTRKEICEGTGNNCGTLGMADIASICNPKRSCNVNKDIGLSTAFTIAHEIGHNLGLHHDGDQLSVDCDADTKYIMAPSFAESTNPHMWSDCSREQLTDFLMSSDSACLENRPGNVGGASGENSTGLLLPGMEYTPTEQCQLQYGNTSTHCTGMQNECQYLWCRSDSDAECSHGNNPPAPGTECHLSWGEVGVCFQGLCMELSLVSEPRDGGWGLWGAWSNCSSACGTGIQFSERECDSPIPANGGRYCSGERRRYRTCNSNSCPGNINVDFRTQFCTDNPPNDRYSSWEAVSLERLLHLGEDTCISHCVPTGTNLLHTTEVKLPDGAPCRTHNSRGVCISGRCQPIGCDHELNAISQRDVCGEWCGNGTSCVSVSGTYSGVKHPGHYRYYPAVTIPTGSTGITIEEVSPSRNNFIAVFASPSGDTLNGEYNVLPNGLSVEFLAGSSWTYERPIHATEILRTNGPISENVTVYLLANSTYEGIRFNFFVPSDLVSELSEVVYYWNESEWSECSMECGRGEQDREISCTKLYPSGQTELTDISSCDPATRPDTRRPCDQGVCLYKWEASDWGMCDSVCGEGRQSRTVVCKWVKKNGTSEEVDDVFCDAVSEPSHVQSCQVESCRYEWHAEEWGKCDSLCGEGWMKREVVCLWMNLWLTNGGELKAATVSDSHCGDSKPEDNIKCDDMEPCENFQWITSEWNECEAPCNTEGTQFRATSCQHRNGTEYSSPFCTQQDPPVSTRPCHRDCPTTTIPPLNDQSPAAATSDSNCSDVDSQHFCNQVVKFSLCHVYRSDCCASCAG